MRLNGVAGEPMQTHRPSGARRLMAKPRPQGGYTLIELLVAIAITAIIFVPLMAWASLAIKQMPVTKDGLTRTAQTGLLGSMFPADVTIAGQAWVSGMGDESWAGDCVGGSAVGGSLQLVMITGGATVKKLVYKAVQSSDDPSEWNIWRRSCGVVDNAVQSEHQLFRGVRKGTTAVTCKSAVDDAPCREIAITTTPVSNDQPIVMSATRRVDAGSVPLDALGNPMPKADITIDFRTAGQQISAGFSSGRSSVGPDRTIASHKWEFDDGVTSSPLDEAAVTATFPPLGSGESERDFTVRLTVTDDLGASNTASRIISSSNINPVAKITSITPDPVEVGKSVTLSALPSGGLPGSYDPDGSIVRFEWMLTLPQANPEVPPEAEYLSGSTVSYVTPAGSAGDVNVVLTVTDLQLGQSTDSSLFTIVDPSAPPTTIPGPTTTIPGGPGVLAAVFTDAPGPSALVRTFDASSSTGVDAGTTFAWTFGDGTSGTGTAVSHTYPNGGVFPVVLTVTTSDSRVVTANRSIELSGGAPAPRNVRHNGTAVLWDPMPGARKYLVDFEFRTATDCFRVIPNQMVGATPKPSKAIPRNPCPRSATGRARVGTDSGAGVNWSSWISIPVINGTAPTTTAPPEVVK